MVLYTWENGIYNPTPFIINNSKNTYIHNGLNTNTNNYAYYIKSSTYCQNSPLFDTAKKHQTILLNAKGFQNLIVLKWNPYLGWDKVKNYSVFRKHSDSTNFNLIATINKITEYFDSAVNCNFTYQYYIIAEENAGNTQVSYSNIVSINSLNPTIPNNPSILRATVNAQNEIQIDWDGSKNNINAIKNYSLERSIDGLNYSAIKQTLDSICCIPFLDYNINTDITSYFYRLSAKDECEIKSNYSNIGKTILLNVIKKNDDIPKLEWNEFIKWQNGVKHYEVEIKDEFGLFNKITNISSSTLFFTDSISNHDNLEQICYRIKAISFDSFSNGIPIESYSNIRCVLGNSILLVPNAFTPNLDANNPKFVVFGNYIKSYHITIFNRWGQLVFESDNINNSWDGTYNQNEMADGIYIYQIRAQGFDNKNFNLKGNITLLR